MDGTPREIIGVLPAGFRFLDEQPQLVLPLRIDRATIHVAGFNYQGIARLKPGATIAQANADIARMIPLLVERFPMPGGFTKKMFEEVKMAPNVRPLADDVIGDVGRVLWVLLGTVAIVLLIACANVANLFLVRAEGRQQELAIHAALGASWRRVAWELLSESLVLALAGGAFGVLLAAAGVRGLVSMAPAGLPRLHEITIDTTVLLFALGVSLVAGLLFGIIPVAKYATPHLAGALKEGGRLSSAGRARHRARNTLVVAEIALAVVLLVAAGLMIRTFQAMRHVSPGFVNPGEVLTLRVSIPSSLVSDPEATTRMHQQIAGRIEQLPGVTSVGVSSSITMDGSSGNDPIFVEDFPGPGGRIPPLRRFKYVGGRYVETMGNRVVAGRPLQWSDSFERSPSVVVSENFAREYWKEPAAALGRRIRESVTGQWRTIVGVVGDERDDGVAQPAPAIVYWPALLNQFWDEKVSRSADDVLRRPLRADRIADAVEGDSAGRVVGQPEPAGRERADARRDPVEIHGADLVCAGDAGHRGRGRAGPRRGRHLRGHFVRRDAADAGDRDPHGARRRDAGRQPVVPAPWADPRDGGGCRRHDCGGPVEPGDVGAALRRQRARSGDVPRRRGRPRRHGAPRELPARAPRRARRSGSGAAVGGVAAQRQRLTSTKSAPVTALCLQV